MSKFQFNRKAQKFRTQKSIILEKMANNAVNFFKVDTFDKKSFDGVPWAPNKVNTGSQQLVKTGRMRQSITILKRTPDTRQVGSNVPYAAYHNSGTKNLPKRQFIGGARALEAKNREYLNSQMKRII